MAEEALIEYKGIQYFNLSDIFEYMDESLFAQVAKKLLDQSADQARLAYWNLMIERRIDKVLPKMVTSNLDLSEALTKADRGFFYNSFIVDEKK